MAIGKWGCDELPKDNKFTLLQLPRNRTEKHALKLRDLLRYIRRSEKECLMRDDLQRFWEYERPSWASKFLDRWCERAMRANIEAMKEMLGTLRLHRRLLLNWFRASGAVSNGSVEGLNNKAKLALEMVYGFKS